MVTRAMIDSGATHCFNGPQIAEEAQLSLQKAPVMTVTLADGTTLNSSHACHFLLLVDGHHMQITARIMDNLSHDIVLGMDWLTKYNPVIVWAAFTVTFPSA